MRRFLRILVPAAFAVAMVGTSLPAGAVQPPHEGTKNIKLMGNVPSSGFRDSDLAFKGKLAFAGNYGGFRVIDVSQPDNPQVITNFPCNGAQGDVSVYGDLLFQSVDAPQSHEGCDSTNVTAATPGMFEGVRVFDISDVENPVHIDSIHTDCGSHTHTLVPDPGNNRVVIYVSSYPLGGAALGPNCVRAEDGGGHSKISVIEVPLDDPTANTVTPYHLDPGTEWATYLGAFTLRACHDISVFTGSVNRAAAACLSEGQVWDISDPLHPQFLYRYDNPNIRPENIDLFHSASFSWDGEVVAFGDESGGGGAARCVDPDDNQGRIWFLNLATGEELASYKIPRSETGTCTMHNFNFVPTKKGQKVLVSSSYTGGTTVVDVDALLDGASETDAEVGWFKGEGDNAWSSYWYNGHIYAHGVRGLDVLLLSDKARASAQKQAVSNPQTQTELVG